MNLILLDSETLAQFPALLNELDQFAARINLVWGKQHDPQTGAHRALTWDGATQGTVGAAGSASALPANPSGYFEITIGGVEYVVPYYRKS